MRKNFIVKQIILLIACVLLLTSCSNQKNEPKQNETQNADNVQADGQEQEPAEKIDIFDPKLPEMDFEGYEFRILTNTSWIDWAIYNLDAAEQVGEPVNDAIYMRNRNIEAKYNFVIKETQMPAAKVSSTLKNGVNRNVAATAIARELACFMWGLMTNNVA